LFLRQANEDAKLYQFGCARIGFVEPFQRFIQGKQVVIRHG
jgi:hypothetical protein